MAGLQSCVHCGICLPKCPTYLVLGEEMDSPRGRIYLMRGVADGRLAPTASMAKHFDLCLGCRGCETACPSGVPFGQLLEATRAQFHQAGIVAPRNAARGRVVNFLLRWFPEPQRFRRLLPWLRFYQRSGLQRVVRGLGLMKPFHRLAAMEALLPFLPDASEPLPALSPATGPRRGKVGLLIGCLQRYAFPDVNRATVRVLNAAGFDVVVPPDQGCCGALHMHSGRLGEARGYAGRLVAAFPTDLDFIVSNSAGCGSTMREYAHWLPEEAVKNFTDKVRDVTEVLAGIDLPLRPLPVKVTYQEPCHLVHGQRVRAEPRAVLRKIPELRLTEMTEGDLCCGSAGVYNLVQPDVAHQLGERKVGHIRASGAEILVSGNPGCIMQLSYHCVKAGLPIEVLHPVQLLDRALGPRA